MVTVEGTEYSFTVYEIDLDYEFDASRFFDFGRPESPLEARQAQTWFDSARTCPPSLPRQDMLMENGDSDAEAGSDVSVMEVNRRELVFYSHMVNTMNSENQTKLSRKPAFPRTSTLMKPTASQLAKQIRTFQAGHSRSCVPALNKTSTSAASTCVIENQAAKRQKLVGGLLRKVMGTVQLQQSSFLHKASKRDGVHDENMTHTKPRITIPRDPDLETSHRAHRTREKGSKDENVTSTVRRFKALPLNRKILDAPSLLPKRSTPRVPGFQEFHLKTLERALQHNSTTFKSTVPLNHSNKDLHKFTANLTTDCGSKEPGIPNLLNNNTSGPEGCQSSHSFKALPLNKKILSSKGDIGVFRNCKKETTVPMEFDFQTEKRFHNNPPPIELFNKLSLACETQPNPKVPWSLSTPAKIKQTAKFNLPSFGGLHQISVEEGNSDVRFARWSKPIR